MTLMYLCYIYSISNKGTEIDKSHHCTVLPSDHEDTVNVGLSFGTKLHRYKDHVTPSDKSKKQMSHYKNGINRTVSDMLGKLNTEIESEKTRGGKRLTKKKTWGIESNKLVENNFKKLKPKSHEVNSLEIIKSKKSASKDSN